VKAVRKLVAYEMCSHPEEMEGWHLALYGTLIQNYLIGFGV
jgi:hypothetical protein